MLFLLDAHIRDLQGNLLEYDCITVDKLLLCSFARRI